MKLYSYWRSSASFRVRIALGLKGLAYDYVPVHLARGEQLAPAHRSLSADGLALNEAPAPAPAPPGAPGGGRRFTFSTVALYRRAWAG